MLGQALTSPLYAISNAIYFWVLVIYEYLVKFLVILSFFFPDKHGNPKLLSNLWDLVIYGYFVQLQCTYWKLPVFCENLTYFCELYMEICALVC